VKPIFAVSVLALVSITFVAPRPGVSANPDPGVGEPGALSVVSLNLARESDPATVLHSIQATPRLRDADVFLFQEVVGEDGEPSVAERVAARLGYFAAFSPEASGVRDRGLAVISRFPMTEPSMHRLKAYDLRFHSRQRFAISTTLRTPEGDIRVWNTHLDTRLNPGQRLEQLDPVIQDAARYSGPRMVGGDLNTNTFYWAWNVLPLPQGGAQGSTIRHAMERHGFRTPFGRVVTHPGFSQQLDWVFLNGLEPVGSSVEPVSFSDHDALWTSLRVTAR
jgi:endonuclease/exonuclease/phosphatase family metal-dependent hydrolase